MKLPMVLTPDGPVVIFGGGQVGLRKVEYVSKFTKDIIVVSDNALPMPEHVELKLTTLKQQDIPKFIPENTSLVIAALSDSELNHTIAKFCRERRILVNVVDDIEPSTVLFPALSHAGELNIAISTSGKCPFLAKKIREEIDDWIFEKQRWLEVLSSIREALVGEEQKNEVLQKIYNNEDINQMVKEGNLEEAKNKAWGIYNVYSKS